MGSSKGSQPARAPKGSQPVDPAKGTKGRGPIERPATRVSLESVPMKFAKGTSVSTYSHLRRDAWRALLQINLASRVDTGEQCD